jgi:hypothetical protein
VDNSIRLICLTELYYWFGKNGNCWRDWESKTVYLAVFSYFVSSDMLFVCFASAVAEGRERSELVYLCAEMENVTVCSRYYGSNREGELE